MVNKVFRKNDDNSLHTVVNMDGLFFITDTNLRVKEATLTEKFTLTDMIPTKPIEKIIDNDLLEQLKVVDDIFTMDAKNIESTPTKEIFNKELYSQPNLNQHTEFQLPPPISQQTFQRPLEPVEPIEFSTFRRVKKADVVKLNISIDLYLPSKDKINALDDMFETSFVDFIASEYAKSIVADSSELTSKIKEQIYNWLNSKTKSVVKAKPITKSKTTKKKIKDETIG